MAEVERFPWLVYPPAVDLANTMFCTPSRRGDLLGSLEDVQAWVAAEQGRIPGAEAVPEELSAVRRARDVVRAVLYEAANGSPPDPAAVSMLNEMSAADPRYPALEGGVLREVSLATRALVVFAGAVARSAIELVGTPALRDLAVCQAPSCGMLFVRATPRQAWCCTSCGNRARVARHASRQRAR